MDDDRRVSRVIAQTPNALCVFRLILAGVFPFIPEAWWLPAVSVGIFSDWADGFIARRLRVTSTLGSILDGISDKLFVFSVAVTMVLHDKLALWEVLLVLSRDFLVAFLVVYVMWRGLWSSFSRMKHRWLGKIATVAQYALIGALLVWDDAVFVTFIIAAASSVAAAGEYLVAFAGEWKADRQRRAQRDEGTEARREEREDIATEGRSV